MNDEVFANLSSKEMAQRYIDEHLDTFGEWASFAEARGNKTLSDYYIWTELMLAKFVLGK